MSGRILVFIIGLSLFSGDAFAGAADTASFATLSKARTSTDLTGMKVLAGWGALNTVAGIAGFASADNEASKHFHQMNAAWGVINLSIAGLGYLGARRELKKTYTSSQALHRYEATKRLYLLNAGLDGLYIATGAFLSEHAKHTGGNRDMYRGFGKSLLLQGAGLLLFDVAMFTAHHRQDKRWYKVLQGVCLTGDGIGWRWAGL